MAILASKHITNISHHRILLHSAVDQHWEYWLKQVGRQKCGLEGGQVGGQLGNKNLCGNVFRKFFLG